MNKSSNKVRSIRFPDNLWEEIMKQAEVTDRSFNRVVIRMLQKQLEQENKKLELLKQQ